MNIFILHTDPVLAAMENCDSHVCKIILEVAQMLGLAHYANGGTPPINRAKTHENNHVSKWVRQSLENYQWTVRHGLALCAEYTHRYGKIHKYEDKMLWFSTNIPALPNIGATPFRQAVAEDCYAQDVVVAYRKYYNKYKCGFSKWTKRPIPLWFVHDIESPTLYNI